jgi:Zn-dependent peptidase ImmA (M78 family)
MPLLYFRDQAEAFAHKAWQTLRLSTPVDLERVAQRLGISVYYEEFVPEIDGIYLRVPGAPPVIAINTSYLKPLGRRRFTTAHEIGHHLLASRVSQSSKLFFFDLVSTRKTMTERACDRFAAMLLMPEDLTRKWFEELSSNPSHRVAIMADRFQVSTDAMRVRLKELGLPYQLYHYRTR